VVKRVELEPPPNISTYIEVCFFDIDVMTSISKFLDFDIKKSLKNDFDIEVENVDIEF
jgi:hypothetical protein